MSHINNPVLMPCMYKDSPQASVDEIMWLAPCLQPSTKIYFWKVQIRWTIQSILNSVVAKPEVHLGTGIDSLCDRDKLEIIRTRNLD